jgi:NADH:ubiquinone oxidoreductase subunit 4 (subunit M)
MLVIVGAWESKHLLSKVPAILAVWGLVITGVYLLRAVKDLWFGEMRTRWQGLRDARRTVERLPYAILVAVLLLFGFWPQPVLSVARHGAESLVNRIDAAAASARAPAPTPPVIPGETR